MDSRNALLAEVVRVVAADAVLAPALGGRVFDAVPQGAAFPFVAMGEMTTAALDGDTPPTLEQKFELEAVSRVSRSEASGLAARLVQLLDGAALAPVGLNLTSLAHAATAVRGAKDGRSWSAKVRLRAVTREV